MKVWTTKDGQQIPYDQLKTSHIFNIIKWAQTKGFSSYVNSVSTVDNSDNVTISYDDSEQVIADMKEELKHRGIHTIYYTALVDADTGRSKRVSIIFNDIIDALNDIRSRSCSFRSDYILVKESVL